MEPTTSGLNDRITSAVQAEKRKQQRLAKQTADQLSFPFPFPVVGPSIKTSTAERLLTFRNRLGGVKHLTQQQPLNCTIHCNYYSIAVNLFQRCALVDQVALFRYVDRFVSTNHCLYHIFREILTTNARVRAWNRSTNRVIFTYKRNLIIVNDGIHQYNPDDLNTITEFDDKVQIAPAVTFKRMLVHSVRHYGKIMEHLQPERLFNERQTFSSTFVKPVKRHNDSTVYENFEDDLFDDDDSDDTSRNERLQQPKHVQPTTKRKRTNLPPVLDDKPSNEDDVDNYHERPSKETRDLEKKTRTSFLLFSKSTKSTRSYYEFWFAAMCRFRHSCDSIWRINRSNNERSIVHNTNDMPSNDTMININPHYKIPNQLLPNCRHTKTTVVTNSSIFHDDAEITSPTCSNTVCERVIITNTTPLYDENLENHTQLLYRRLKHMRERVRDLTDLLQNNDNVNNDVHKWLSNIKHLNVFNETNTKPTISTTNTIGQQNDEKLVETLIKLLHENPKTAPTYSVHFERELSLVQLAQIIEHIVHLAHSAVYSIYDFVFYTEFDAWFVFNETLDYGLRTFNNYGYFPVKQALWDIFIVQVNNNNTNDNYYDDHVEPRQHTENMTSVHNYDIVWIHPPTTMNGNLLLFVQSFRQFLRMIISTSCCFFLNHRSVNTRATAPKHECFMPKASVGMYYSLFLRMTIGHDLICTYKLETEENAVQWLSNYNGLSYNMWRKRRIPKSLLLDQFLASYLHTQRQQHDHSIVEEQTYQTETTHHRQDSDQQNQIDENEIGTFDNDDDSLFSQHTKNHHRRPKIDNFDNSSTNTLNNHTVNNDTNNATTNNYDTDDSLVEFPQ